MFGKTEEEHDHNLKRVMEKLTAANLKLNRSKCEFKKKEVHFLGHKISETGAAPDPSKIKAILEMPDPTNLPELRRFMGMVNYLGRYLPDLSTVLKPISQLLEKNREWVWGPAQAKAAAKVREMLTEAPTLAFFDPHKAMFVSADTSSYGLGAVLLQEHPEGLRAVAYASRTLTDAEERYAQIEKECLATTWACEKFERYLVGLPEFQIYTDHKPLVPLMNSKELSETPLRCQRLLLRLMRFNFKAVHVPGKSMHVADALSRSPIDTKGDDSIHLEVQSYVNEVMASWPMRDARLTEIREKTPKDVNLQAAMHYTINGWPENKADVQLAAKDFFILRNELSVCDGLLIRGDRIVIPYSMREEILERIHDGHLGIVKCRERAKQCVWWPKIADDIRQTVSKCRKCLEKQPTQRAEPLMPSDPPERPYQRVSADICEVDKAHYLVVVDCYSRYLDIANLSKLTAKEVVEKMKSCFAQHGVPETVVTDNGTQFSSGEFKQFTRSWNFCHMTSSPHYPQANGQAESAVKIAKGILKQTDPFLALLTYRSTPIPALGASPAELACGRKFRTTLPVLPKTLIPCPINPASVCARDILNKQHQKHAYDAHHGVQPLRELQPGQQVVIKLDDEKGWKLPGEVVHQHAPRSYIIQTPRGRLRRNRRHLRPDITIDEQGVEPPHVQQGQSAPTEDHSDEDPEPVSIQPTGGQPGLPLRVTQQESFQGTPGPPPRTATTAPSPLQRSEVSMPHQQQSPPRTTRCGRQI